MYEWSWVWKWGPHKCLGIASMLSVSEVWKNKSYLLEVQLKFDEYYAPVVLVLVLILMSTPKTLYSTQVFKYSPVITWGPASDGDADPQQSDSENKMHEIAKKEDKNLFERRQKQNSNSRQAEASYESRSTNKHRNNCSDRAHNKATKKVKNYAHNTWEQRPQQCEVRYGPCHASLVLGTTGTLFVILLTTPQYHNLLPGVCSVCPESWLR